MALTSSFSTSRVRSIAIAGLAVLAGAGVIGAGSAHAATTPASSPTYQQAPNTSVPAGIVAPVQSVGGGGFQSVGGSQGTGSGDPGPPNCTSQLCLVAVIGPPPSLRPSPSKLG